MNLLKRIPIRYAGELHDVRLVNFTVDIDEVKNMVPAQIKIRSFGNKAMISMVDVKLKKMHPDFMPSFMHFEYRHIAFRLLVDDATYNCGDQKGIYFLKSFTNKPHIVLGGKILTNYNLEIAQIEDKLDCVIIKQGQEKLIYQRDDKPASEGNYNEGLQNVIGAIDRAYSIEDEELKVTQILREKWPLLQVECAFFENTFFNSSELQGVFKVNEMINYQWLPPRAVIPYQ